MSPGPRARNTRNKPQSETIRAAKIGGLYTLAAAVIGAIVGAALTNGFGLFSAAQSATPITSPSPSTGEISIFSLTSGTGRVVASGSYADVPTADQIYLVATFPDHQTLFTNPAAKSVPGATSGDWNINSAIGPFPGTPTWRWAIWQCSVPGPQCNLIARQQLALHGLHASGIVASRVYQGVVLPGSAAASTG